MRFVINKSHGTEVKNIHASYMEATKSSEANEDKTQTHSAIQMCQ